MCETQVSKPAQMSQVHRQGLQTVLSADIPGLRAQFGTIDAQMLTPKLAALTMIRVFFRGITNELLTAYTFISAPRVQNRRCKFNGHVVNPGSSRCMHCDSCVDAKLQKVVLGSPRRSGKLSTPSSCDFWVDERVLARQIDSKDGRFRSAW